MLFILALFVLVLFVLDIPRDIQAGINGQVAIKELDGMRHPLLKIKNTVSLFHIDKNIVTAKSDLEKLAADAESCLHQYKNATEYNEVLSKKVADFTAAYNKWIFAENRYLTQFYEANYMQSGRDEDLDRRLVLKASENNTLFLLTLQLLADGEIPLHDDIAKGRQAYQILQLTTAFFAICFFILVFLFQRNLGREYAVREKNLEVILKSIGDAVIATDLQGNVTCMNSEAERLTGWTLEDAKGRALSEVYKVVKEHSDELAGNVVEQVLQAENVVDTVEDLVLIATDGSHYPVEENGSAIYDDSGQTIGVVLVFRDITQRHALESRLDESANRLKRVIDSSMDAVIVMDESGMVKEWNPAAEVMFGWTFEEIVKQPVHEMIIPQEFRQRHLQGIEQFIRNKQTGIHARRIESIAMYRDGHTFPIELAMTSVHSQQGWLFNAFIRDISAQKHKENLLKKNDLLLRESHRIAKLGYWELDIESGELEWSDEIYRMFCVDPANSKASYDLFMSFVHPEDRERVDKAYKKSLEIKKPYNIIHRIVTDEGVKIVHEQCDTTFEEGKPVRSLGLVQDITERANDLDELRLAATMFKSYTGILITETDGTILRVNPAFEEMTGYSSNELVGQNPRILQSGKQDREFYKNMWGTVANDGSWQGELCNKRKDGSEYIEWLTLTAVNNDAGQVTHYVGTSQDITERKKAESQIEYLAYHDDLTDLANRRLLHDRLHQYIAACKRHNEYGAVLLLDLDRFKDLNDSLGHSVGDGILCQVASRLQKIVREEDTVARLGGDEFVVVLSSLGQDLVTIARKVQAIAEKIRLSLLQPYEQKNGQCYSTVSIGITLFPERTDDIEDIIKHADTALYRAKEQGRNTVCFYQSSMQAEVDARLAIGDGLRNAIKNNELVLHYQPQVDDKGELLGAEALVRWQHPEQGMVPPGKFILVAEENGLILDIGLWVLKEAARQVAEWHAAGICIQGTLRLSVNVSPRQFNQQDFTAQVLAVFEQAGVSPDCFELEVTESMLMDELDDIVKKIDELRKHGVRISIDDFGTGYSSLAYLKKLPLDQLKIDQSFIRDITSDDNDAMVVETIIAMASHLNLAVIAEGVENQQQLDFLIEKGCKAFQGYYFSRPLTNDDFGRYITERAGS